MDMSRALRPRCACHFLWVCATNDEKRNGGMQTLLHDVALFSRPRLQLLWQASGVWRNGSASDSRSEGWEFESLCPHFGQWWQWRAPELEHMK